MGLIKCQDCGREISAEASACPSCGRPGTAAIKSSYVPETINFSDLLLFTPSLEEAGVAPQVGMLGIFETKVKVGQWVERGDPLLTASYESFKSPRKTFLNLFHDPKQYRRFTLECPVSGLVLGFRDELFRLDQPWNTYYLKSEALPVIILPKDEPPQASWVLRFYDQIGDYLKYAWRALAYYPGSGDDIRFSEVASRSNNWKDDIDEIERFKGPIIEKFAERPLSASDIGYIRAVQNLRAHDLLLRDKLAHLAIKTG